MRTCEVQNYHIKMSDHNYSGDSAIACNIEIECKSELSSSSVATVTPYTIPLRFGDISYMERRYRGSIEYRDTYGGVGIVVPISGIAQH